MSNKISVPLDMSDHKGSIRVQVKLDNTIINITQPNCEVTLPKGKSEPTLIIVQAINGNQVGTGIKWVYINKNWMPYVESLHGEMKVDKVKSEPAKKTAPDTKSAFSRLPGEELDNIPENADEDD